MQAAERLILSLKLFPKQEKRVTLLNIPKANRAYWELIGTEQEPSVTPFVAPALSGWRSSTAFPTHKMSPKEAGTAMESTIDGKGLGARRTKPEMPYVERRRG